MEKKYIEELWEGKTPNTYLETIITIFAICVFIGMAITGVVYWFNAGDMLGAVLIWVAGLASTLGFLGLATIIRLLRQIRDNTKKRF